ncbi:hypothetical protein BGZ80_010101 [Entomortierella chlamydospora]|uniref:F-box domain-containing protein n=1 Tax=Entomortierella chlamydospora TaxID=101097 RepID=A0A9P6MW19_9FUNG|nr:hypothetical protein BGZ79_009892 [Entomortierella chlamydospora]KAG0015003.1 hypothetical protein BGZ80_010101 [Entomortierella chlamydospora]
MPHIVESGPSMTGLTTAGIGVHTTSATTSTITTKYTSSPLAKQQQQQASDSDYATDSGSDSETDSMLEQQLQQLQLESTKRRRRDLFSQLPANVLQTIFALLPPFQMLTISELSRKFYNFVVLSQEMNEVWFKLVKHEEAEEKKRAAWFKQKLLEQEQRSVQMMRSFSGSSTCSNMSCGSFADENSPAISKQAQRLLNKKQEAAGGRSSSAVKVMKRTDRKKNWCKIYVDSILRGNSEGPLLPMDQVMSGSKKTRTFQTIVLNETLPEEHFREYRGSMDNEESKELSREAKTQIKIEKRMHYKSIRSKPKGKKPSQMDSSAAKIDKIAPWKQPGWAEQEQFYDEDY